MAHGPKNQSTGSFKGPRKDKHQKVEHNQAKKKDNWVDLGKNTNSDRNKGRKK